MSKKGMQPKMTKLFTNKRNQNKNINKSHSMSLRKLNIWKNNNQTKPKNLNSLSHRFHLKVVILRFL